MLLYEVPECSVWTFDVVPFWSNSYIGLGQMWNSYPFYVTHLVKLFGVVVKRKKKKRKKLIFFLFWTRSSVMIVYVIWPFMTCEIHWASKTCNRSIWGSFEIVLRRLDSFMYVKCIGSFFFCSIFLLCYVSGSEHYDVLPLPIRNVLDAFAPPDQSNDSFRTATGRRIPLRQFSLDYQRGRSGLLPR